jgi:hypothetical protein
MKTIVITVLVAVLGLAAIIGSATAVVAADVASKAKDDAESASEAVSRPGTHAAAATTSATGLVSYAGQTADNAEDLAAQREPFPAELPPVPDGDVVNVELTLKDVEIEIAPGVTYAAWGFEGGARGLRSTSARARRCGSR